MSFSSLSLPLKMPTASSLFPSLLTVLIMLACMGCQSMETKSPTATNGAPFPWNKMRLPDYVLPVHYNLMIHANLTTLTFSGVTEVEISVHQPTSFIILHSQHLQITRATLRGKSQDNGTEQPLTVLEHLPSQQIALLANQPLQMGRQYIVAIEYAALLSDSFRGFYKSSYRTQKGEVR